ncbi:MULTISPECIES: FliG C-terminal domain-containing protein [Jannaschia]|nr:MULTISPECIES: FliG C-terminal domain-containing protein [unclassified Jannaschia]
MTQLSPTFPPPFDRRHLSQGQKAAVIVRLLINGGADPGIRHLPKEQQRRLVRDMASLRFVDRDTLAATVAEFASELDSIALHFPREIDRVLATLDGSLSLDVVEGLIAEVGGDVGALGDAAWDTIGLLDEDVILDLMSGETPEICAIILSKLPAAKAASLIGQLEKEQSEAVAAAFSRTEDVTPEAVSRIGNALGRQSDSRAQPAFETAAVTRVANILNLATSAVRQALLDRLEATDPGFAARVRKTVFSFENIPQRLDPRDAPRVLRGVDNAVLVTALAGANAAQAKVGEFLLSAISSRLADQIREDIGNAGKVTSDQAEEAMAEIVTAIRTLEESGELSLLVQEDSAE